MDLSKLFLFFVISFFVGIFVADRFIEGDFVKIGVVFVGVVVLFVKLKWNILVLLVVLIGMLFGGFRFVGANEGGGIEEGFVEIEGCIASEVDVRDDKVKYTLSVSGISGKVLVNADRYPVYEYGDCLSVKGWIEIPEKIEDFSYDKYLARYGIYYVMYRSEIERVEFNDANVFFQYIYSLKEWFEGRLNIVYAEPHASFMAGLLLGTRRGIPSHLMENFNTTGLTHIIAISGWNITLVIVLVSGLFGFLGRKKKVIAAIFFIVCFCILVGASAAVVRAGIMGSIGLAAVWFGRQYFVGMALLLSAFIMNLWNPMILIYDVGFQLSFLATAGLIYVSPLIERFFKWLPGGWGIRESVLMTMSAQIMALPVIVYNFGRLSLISPIANVFVLPFIPLAMMMGFLSTIAGNLVGVFGYLILELILLFVKIFASVKFASIDIAWFPWWLVLLYYVFLGKYLIRAVD